jgi:hypothetical protein
VRVSARHGVEEARRASARHAGEGVDVEFDVECWNSSVGPDTLLPGSYCEARECKGWV